MIGKGNTQPATPEEQDQAQRMLASIENYLSSEENAQAIIQSMQQSGEDPSTFIGKMVGQLLHANVLSAKDAGMDISRDILIAVAAEVINAIIEMAMSAGIINIADDKQLEQLQGDSLISAIDEYMGIGDPEVNGEAAKAVANKAMSGEMDSQEAQQGMINNMVGGMA